MALVISITNVGEGMATTKDKGAGAIKVAIDKIAIYIIGVGIVALIGLTYKVSADIAVMYNEQQNQIGTIKALTTKIENLEKAFSASTTSESILFEKVERNTKDIDRNMKDIRTLISNTGGQ